MLSKVIHVLSKVIQKLSLVKICSKKKSHIFEINQIHTMFHKKKNENYSFFTVFFSYKKLKSIICIINYK